MVLQMEKIEKNKKEVSLSKADIIYKALQEEIVEGRISPGERLVERNLMERFKVSKTPVREALLKLKQDGLVEGGLYQGISVIRISREDAIEIYDLREVLEGLAARKAAERITLEEATKLRSFIEVFQECVEKNDVKRYTLLDLKFHNLLGKIGKNKRLMDMMQRFHSQSRVLLRTSLNLPTRGPLVSFNEHKKIIRRILDKNPHLAERMAKEHVRKTKQAVLEWFDNLIK